LTPELILLVSCFLIVAKSNYALKFARLNGHDDIVEKILNNLCKNEEERKIYLNSISNHIDNSISSFYEDKNIYVSSVKLNWEEIENVKGSVWNDIEKLRTIVKKDRFEG
jgi:hypothetical protein